MSSVLVTGGLGVNGAPVLEALVRKGVRPVVVDTRHDLSLVDAETQAGIEVIIGDFTDEALIAPLLRREGMKAVIHMAALVGNAQEMPLEAFRVNAYGTAFLLDLAQRCGVRRFVFTSTRGVYGEQPGAAAHPTYKPIHEDDPVRPYGVYDVCKVAAEGLCRNIARAHPEMEFIALRFATIFAPGKALRHKNYGILSEIIEGGVSGRPVNISQGGDQKDDLIYVADVADAIVLAAFCPKPRHDVYNIATGVGVTLNDLADAVRKIAPEADIKIGPGLNYMQWPTNYSGVLDATRAAEDLGFRTRYDLATAVADYVKRYRSLG